MMNNNVSTTTAASSQERGNALILALLAMMLAVAVMLWVTQISAENFRRTDRHETRVAEVVDESHSEGIEQEPEPLGALREAARQRVGDQRAHIAGSRPAEVRLLQLPGARARSLEFNLRHGKSSRHPDPSARTQM